MSLALRVIPRALLFLSFAVGSGVAGQGRVGGRIFNANSKLPLASVQVHIIGTTIGMLTSPDGRYVLPNVPAGAHQIRAERIGYKPQTTSITVQAGQLTTADFTIAEEPLSLDAVVVTGTAGSARRREIGNTITQINTNNVAEPVKSVESLIQGRSAGVVVNMGGSTMGQGAAIRLRGNVSVSQSNQPLIYVDGVKQTTDAYPRAVSRGGSTFSGSQTQSSPLNDINPADIERVEIIKGAAAATLYGTEAAAGVIQIFTKKGASGKPLWTYQTDQGVSWIEPYGSDVRPLLGMDRWLKSAYGQKHALSVSGGSDAAQYFVSGNYEDRDGVLPDDHEKRYSMRGNFTMHPARDLTLDFNSFFSSNPFSVSPNGNSGESLFFNVYRAPVNTVQSEDPLVIDSLLQAKTNQTNDRLILGGTVRWLPLQNFSNRFTVGYDRAMSAQEIFHPFNYIEQRQGDIAEVNFKSQTVTLDYVGSYDLGITKTLRSTLSVGAQLLRTESDTLDGFGRGLPGPGKQTLSAASVKSVFQQTVNTNTGGFFGQALFNVRDRYFITGGLRVDGNSAFGKSFGLQAYPKLSASYVISDERFFPKGLGQLKLRGAFGFAGRAPGAFDAVRTWSATPFVGQTAYLPANLGNAALGPERTREFEGGFDGTTWSDRLTYEFTYYTQNTLNALFAVQAPPSLGFVNTQLQNVGELNNKGIEISLNATVLRKSFLTWDLGVNASTNNSKILNTGASVSTTLVAGYPAPVVRGARVRNPDALTDPDIELNAFIGPNQPTKIVGGSTTFRFRHGLLFTARGEYQGGHWLNDFPSTLVVQRGPHGAVGCDNVYKIVPWADYDGVGSTPARTPAGVSQLRAIDRALCYKNTRSDIWNVPADFFKLREVTAQWQLPFTLPRAKTTYITVSGRNWWRWVNKDFRSFDPELISSRTQITALTFGISDQIPPPASTTLSIKLTF